MRNLFLFDLHYLFTFFLLLLSSVRTIRVEIFQNGMIGIHGSWMLLTCKKKN